MNLFRVPQAFLSRMPFMARLLVLMLALLHVCSGIANMASTSHDMATWSGHDNATLLASQSGGHDHNHDEPEVDDGSNGHQHGHHAADHSHDKPNLSGDNTLAVVRLEQSWRISLAALAYPAPCFSFERPPKALSMS